MLFPAKSFSADISIVDFQQNANGSVTPSALVIEGDLVAGDFTKVVQSILSTKQSNFPIGSLYLAGSSGGDLMEAMKIGELVNELYMKAFIIDDCYSACAFIALSAQHRVFIGAIGLHRPYFAKEYYNGLSAQEAKHKYNELRILAENYLLKNYVSKSVVDKMFSVSSTDAWVLDGSEAKNMFGNFQPPVEEWIKTECDPTNSSLGIDNNCALNKLHQAQVESFVSWVNKLSEMNKNDQRVREQ